MRARLYVVGGGGGGRDGFVVVVVAVFRWWCLLKSSNILECLGGESALTVRRNETGQFFLEITHFSLCCCCFLFIVLFLFCPFLFV